MLTIPKHHVQNLLRVEHLARLSQVDTVITLYTKRYGVPFAAFEERITTAPTEDMSTWDDYIEWAAYEQSRTEILTALKELRNGEFEFA